MNKLWSKPWQIPNLNRKPNILQKSNQYHKDLFLGETGWNRHIFLTVKKQYCPAASERFRGSHRPMAHYHLLPQNWPGVLTHRRVTASVIPPEYSCLDQGWIPGRSSLGSKCHGKPLKYSVQTVTWSRP